MIVDYIKLSPTGNITLLVKTPVPREGQRAASLRLLESVGGEQVGFIEPPDQGDARLQMMGGEFCGNATMSLGAVLCRDAGLDEAALTLEVSGSDGPVPCQIRRGDDGWVGTVRMPLPTAMRRATLETDAGAMEAPLVEMPGIAHLILPARSGLDEAQLRRRLPEWNKAIGADALGALLWDEADRAIDPLVYVPSAGTLVREHGCGSGSAAVGCWLSEQSARDIHVGIRQPGGVITVDTRRAGSAIAALAITGRVTILEEGCSEI